MVFENADFTPGYIRSFDVGTYQGLEIHGRKKITKITIPAGMVIFVSSRNCDGE